MSLVKSPKLTPAKLAANQTNALRSVGPVTPEGRLRAQVSNLRHALYVLAPENILETLGESAVQFEIFEEKLTEQWQPIDAFQRSLVRRIVHNSWRLERARRVQECTMISEVERLQRDREAKAESHERQIEGVLAALGELLDMARRGDFTDAAGALFERAYGLKPSARGMEILRLMTRLSPGLRLGSGPETQDTAPPPPGGVAAGEGARADARLCALLESEIESARRYDEFYRRTNIEVTAAEMQSKLAPVQRYAAVMIRQEESLARQIERDVRLLYYLQDQEKTTLPRAAKLRASAAHLRRLVAKSAARR